MNFRNVNINLTRVKFKNNHVVYENFAKCTIKDYEFNLSYNPTLLSGSQALLVPYRYTSGSYTGSQTFYEVTGSEYYGILKDFATGSTSGSEFSPYITTIGLYNDAQDLLAVAKMAVPTPLSPNTDMTFLVKFDTQWNNKPYFTPTPSPSRTPYPTLEVPSNSPSPTPTNTPTVTPTVTPTISATPSITPTISTTPSISVTPSITPTVTVTPSITVTPSTPAENYTLTITDPGTNVLSNYQLGGDFNTDDVVVIQAVFGGYSTAVTYNGRVDLTLSNSSAGVSNSATSTCFSVGSTMTWNLTTQITFNYNSSNRNFLTTAVVNNGSAVTSGLTVRLISVNGIPVSGVSVSGNKNNSGGSVC